MMRNNISMLVYLTDVNLKVVDLEIQHAHR